LPVSGVLQAAILTIALATPLIFVRGLNDNFELPKQTAVRLLLTASLSLAVGLGLV
jgi:hypothetical protein